MCYRYLASGADNTTAPKFSGMMTRCVILRLAEEEQAWGSSLGLHHRYLLENQGLQYPANNDFIQNTESWSMSVAVTLSHPSLGSQADGSKAQPSAGSRIVTSFRGCRIYGPIFSCVSLEMLDHSLSASLEPSDFSETRQRLVNVAT